MFDLWGYVHKGLVLIAADLHFDNPDRSDLIPDDLKGLINGIFVHRADDRQRVIDRCIRDGWTAMTADGGMLVSSYSKMGTVNHGDIANAYLLGHSLRGYLRKQGWDEDAIDDRIDLLTPEEHDHMSRCVARLSTNL